jgi:alpha-methylacyl-CoA racemase
MSGPLKGLRVVEMAGLGPGPFCAMLLADMGAEVIRIQQKGARSILPALNTKYDVLARGRRSMAIDLKKPGARDAVLALIGKADALIEGFRPGVMERLGLGPDACLERNAKLIYGRMTGWGQTGPLAHRAGHDINYVALSGILNALGRADAPPAPPLNVVADMGGGGLLLAFGMVCALLEARQSGKGQVVDAAMTDGSALLASMILGFKAAGFWSSARGANLLDGGAYFYGVYACADGKDIAIGPIEPQFHALLLEKLGLDPRDFQQANPALWPQYKARLAEAFKTRARDEWVALLDGLDTCATPVLDWDEAIAHPHNRARETFVEIAGVPQPAPAPRFSRTAPETPAPAARADEHTAAILADWGIPEAEVDALKASEAISSTTQ